MAGKVSQSFEHMLNPIKGWSEFAGNLDHDAPLAASILNSPTSVPPGRVVHLNSAGEFALGATGKQMPIFLFQGRDGLDVQNPGDSPTTGIKHWHATGPTKVASGLVATGGFEVETTEFDDDLTYASNDLLRSDASGVLTKSGVTLYTTLVCGVCSFNRQHAGGRPAPTSPKGVNANQVTTLTFWTCYLPGTS